MGETGEVSSIPESVIHHIRLRARYGVSSGRAHLPVERTYNRRCTHLHMHTGTLVMFTRDTGHHTSGWMKNPDYERCLHLSLSFRDPYPEVAPDRIVSPHAMAETGRRIALAPFDRRLALQWVRLVLDDAAHLSWEEGAFSREGRELSVRHWRVFCDPSWAPLKPRAEVYTRDFTEKGWRSWGELHPEPNWVDAS